MYKFLLIILVIIIFAFCVKKYFGGNSGVKYRVYTVCLTDYFLLHGKRKDTKEVKRLIASRGYKIIGPIGSVEELGISEKEKIYVTVNDDFDLTGFKNYENPSDIGLEDTEPEVDEEKENYMKFYDEFFVGHDVDGSKYDLIYKIVTKLDCYDYEIPDWIKGLKVLNLRDLERLLVIFSALSKDSKRRLNIFVRVGKFYDDIIQLTKLDDYSIDIIERYNLFQSYVQSYEEFFTAIDKCKIIDLIYNLLQNTAIDKLRLGKILRKKEKFELETLLNNLNSYEKNDIDRFSREIINGDYKVPEKFLNKGWDKLLMEFVPSGNDLSNIDKLGKIITKLKRLKGGELKDRVYIFLLKLNSADLFKFERNITPYLNDKGLIPRIENMIDLTNLLIDEAQFKNIMKKYDIE